MRGRTEPHGRIAGVVRCKGVGTFMKWLAESRLPASSTTKRASDQIKLPGPRRS